MKIVVLNRLDLKKYKSKYSNKLLIRVTSVSPLLELSDTYKKELTYFFDDSYENNLISIEEAKEIVREIKNNYDEIVVSCDYGKGRSPAIANAISDIFKMEFDINSYHDLNLLVYTKIMKAFYAV